MTIVGNPPEPTVSADDDGFHPPTSDDPTWIETVWFPFWLPELGASIHTRVWFRPNEGLQGGAVTAWKGENRYLAHDSWTEELATPPDLRDLEMAGRFRLEVVEPLRTYRVTHTSEHIDVEVTFRALMEPNPVAPEESPGMFAGHLEQPGRVQGRVRLADRWFDVDCGSVRDRSWGPRTMRPGLRLGNAHGTTVDGTAFFAYVNPDPDGPTERITSGYWQSRRSSGSPRPRRATNRVRRGLPGRRRDRRPRRPRPPSPGPGRVPEPSGRRRRPRSVRGAEPGAMGPPRRHDGVGREPRHLVARATGSRPAARRCRPAERADATPGGRSRRPRR